MTGKTVLIVEDNQDFLDALSETLLINGYHVRGATNGQSALHLAHSLLPDAILCDIGIPVYDGFEVYHKLKNSDITSKIPFIFVTGRSNIADIRSRTGLDRKRILIKPFAIDDLLRTLYTLTERHD